MSDIEELPDYNKFAEIGSGILRCTVAWHNKGLLIPVSIFLIKTGDSSWIIVDSGLETTWDALNSALDGVLKPGDTISHMIPTHAHLDHIGAFDLLKKRFPDIIPAIMKDEIPFVLGTMKFAEGAASPMSVFSLIGKRMLPETWVPKNYSKDQVLVLNDGDMLGGGTIQVYHTPGHTPGSTSILHVPTGGIIIGDSLMMMVSLSPSLPCCGGGHKKPFLQGAPTLSTMDPRKNIASVKKLLGMSSIKNFWPSHDSTFNGLAVSDAPDAMESPAMKELDAKIAREIAVRDGARKMLTILSDRMAKEKCQADLLESEKRLDYLRNQKSLLMQRASQSSLSSIQSGASVSSTGSLTEISIDPGAATPNHNKSRESSSTNLSATTPVFEHLKHDPNYTTQKVRYKLQEVRSKLEIEQRVREGTEKMSQALANTPNADQRLKDEAAAKMSECAAKVMFLSEAEKRYKGLYVDTETTDSPSESNAILQGSSSSYSNILSSSESTVSPVGSAPGTPHSARAPRFTLTGHLRLRILTASNIPGRRSPNTQMFVVVRVDGVERAQTKTTRKDWNEDFDIPIDRSHDVEISVYDEDGKLLSLIWFKLHDLEEDLKYVIAKADNVSTSSLHTASTGASSGAAKQPEPMETWLDMEPGGQIRVRLNFLSDAILSKKDEGIFRRQPVKKGVFARGHKFIQQQFYQPLMCSVCNSFLMFGLRCEHCRYTAHKECHRQSLKCIIKSYQESRDNTQDKSQRAFNLYHIPHRFEPSTVTPPAWCHHCGQLLPLGRNQARRCSECKLQYHRECESVVPNYCGMTVSTLNQMLGAIEGADAMKRQKLLDEELAAAQAQSASEKPAAAVNQPAVASRPVAPSSASATIVAPDVKKPSAATSGSNSDLAIPPNRTSSSARKIGLDDFTFLAVLGKGAFGKVMLAEERKSGKMVAIKALRKDHYIQTQDVESIRSELRVFLIASRGHHPFLVNLYSCFQTKTRVYFVMDYAAGGDLMFHIQAGRFTMDRIRFYAAEVLLALEYFHKHNVVYRDLKPENVMLVAEGHVKLVDYGICRENMRYGDRTNTFCGTPDFMAPEILMGDPYTRAVDWWSYGVLLYVMWARKYPYKGDDEREILDAIMDRPISWPQDRDPELVSLITRLLQANPAKRLGAGRSDADEIKRHPWFNGVDWDALSALKAEPPFKPYRASATDVSNFDRDFTREDPLAMTPVFSRLSEADQDSFKGFQSVMAIRLLIRTLVLISTFLAISAQKPIITFSLSPSTATILDINGLNNINISIWTNISSTDSKQLNVIADGCGQNSTIVTSIFTNATNSSSGSRTIAFPVNGLLPCSQTRISVVGNSSAWGSIASLNSTNVTVQYAPSLNITSPANGVSLTYMNGFQVGISTNASLYTSAVPNFTAFIYPPCISTGSFYQLVPTYTGSSVIRSYLVSPGAPLQLGAHCPLKIIGNDGAYNSAILANITVTFVARTLTVVQPVSGATVSVATPFVVRMSNSNFLGTALLDVGVVGAGCMPAVNYSLGSYTATQVTSGVNVVVANYSTCVNRTWNLVVAAPDVTSSVSVNLVLPTSTTSKLSTISTTVKTTSTASTTTTTKPTTTLVVSTQASTLSTSSSAMTTSFVSTRGLSTTSNVATTTSKQTTGTISVLSIPSPATIVASTASTRTTSSFVASATSSITLPSPAALGPSISTLTTSGTTRMTGTGTFTVATLTTTVGTQTTTLSSLPKPATIQGTTTSTASYASASPIPIVAASMLDTSISDALTRVPAAIQSVDVILSMKTTTMTPVTWLSTQTLTTTTTVLSGTITVPNPATLTIPATLTTITNSAITTTTSKSSTTAAPPQNPAVVTLSAGTTSTVTVSSGSSLVATTTISSSPSNIVIDNPAGNPILMQTSQIPSASPSSMVVDNPAGNPVFIAATTTQSFGTTSSPAALTTTLSTAVSTTKGATATMNATVLPATVGAISSSTGLATTTSNGPSTVVSTATSSSTTVPVTTSSKPVTTSSSAVITSSSTSITSTATTTGTTQPTSTTKTSSASQTSSLITSTSSATTTTSSATTQTTSSAYSTSTSSSVPITTSYTTTYTTVGTTATTLSAAATTTVSLSEGSGLQPLAPSPAPTLPSIETTSTTTTTTSLALGAIQPAATLSLISSSPSPSPTDTPTSNINTTVILAATFGALGAVGAAGAAAFFISRNNKDGAARARRIANARVTASGNLVTASGDVLNASTDLVDTSEWGIGMSRDMIQVSRPESAAVSTNRGRVTPVQNVHDGVDFVAVEPVPIGNARPQYYRRDVRKQPPVFTPSRPESSRSARIDVVGQSTPSLNPVWVSTQTLRDRPWMP
ncbi:hypothetical protein SmJEL517_g04588 [Synchytrium microbalum]|uniref:protein kinase C n=1 Tax=Synchytrium microbalum TaxID=1806994 RepID=A0A507BYR5_9FUNG|nr:uncharacterized protein SmJEL517_g04588 [Synchytrium microbalum]TPX32251.1 hypothetical protein SmJEL517_g04588 [Synchytrium microbalum]